MDKKAQFYLFTAVILIILAAGIIPKSVQVYEKGHVFNELAENFEDEIVHVVNNAIYHNISAAERIEGFSISFLNYARQRDPNFGYVLMLRDSNETIISNRLKESTAVKPEGDPWFSVAANDHAVTEPYDSLIVEIEDGRFGFNMSREVEIKILFKSVKNENIYIREVH